MKGTHKHTKASLKRFDDHRYLSQSEERKCMRTYGKDGDRYNRHNYEQTMF